MEPQTYNAPTVENTKHFLRGLSDSFAKAVNDCTQCHQLCHQMINHCVAKGGLHADSRHIRIMEDCAQICAFTADFLIQESHFHVQISDLCADICEATARDCERLASDDSMMQVCADLCVRTAESCRALIGN